MYKCKQCGNEYKSLGQHWRMSSCQYPIFTEIQWDILVGSIMGDGSVNIRERQKPSFQWFMTNENYLNYIDKIFGNITTGVRLAICSEEKAKRNRESGFHPEAQGKNYSDQYYVRTRGHKQLKELEGWYSSGKKVWPPDIELTPTVLKHWFVQDGTWKNDGSSNYIRIAAANEIENTNKINKMFKDSGLPCPNNFDINRTHNTVSGVALNITFTVNQSKELWEYMGKPLPGFGYKWPEVYH